MTPDGPTPAEEAWLELLREPRKSNCSLRRYEAVVLDAAGDVVSTGGNRVPATMAQCEDGGCPRASREVTPGVDHSDCFAVHAEAEALLLSAPGSRASMVVSGPPCFECAKLVAGSGVGRLVFRYADGYPELPKVLGFLHDAGVTVEMAL